MMNKNAPVGFSQFIKRAWLDFTVQQKLEGHSAMEVRTALDNFLADQVSVGSNARRNSRQRAISILSKIWLNIPQSLDSFKEEGLAQFKKNPENMRIAIHWGMAMATYPFFAAGAENMGRLLKLQNEVSTVQLQKRMREKLGERDTVTRATRQLIRCWTEWGILTEGENKGVYQVVSPMNIDSQLTTWLLESALIASQEKSAIMQNLVNTPALFPFRLSSDYFTPNERLETFNQGVNEVGVTFNYSQRQPTSLPSK
jgi:hypothetical protein